MAQRSRAIMAMLGTSVQAAGVCDQTWLFHGGDRAGPQGDPNDRDGRKWEADQTTVLAPRRRWGTPRLSTNQNAWCSGPRPRPRTVAIFVLVATRAMWVPTLGHANVLSGGQQHWFGERMARATFGSIDQSWPSTTRKIGVRNRPCCGSVTSGCPDTSCGCGLST